MLNRRPPPTAANEIQNPFDPAQEHTHSEVVVSATLYLLSRFAISGGCSRLSHVIRQHLRLMAKSENVDPLIRKTCAQLIEEWEQFAAQTYEPPHKAQAVSVLQSVLRKAMSTR